MALSRRALMGAAPALAAIAVPAGAKARDVSTKRREFIEAVAELHERGRFVATRAMALGHDPDACVTVQLYSRGRDELMPALFFKTPGRSDWAVVDARQSQEGAA